MRRNPIQLYFTAAAAILWLAAAPRAAAQDQTITPPAAGAAVAPEIRDAQEISDAALMTVIVQEANGGGFAKLSSHIPDLQGVLSHAPASYPKIVQRGNQIYIRADDTEDYALEAVIAGTIASKAATAAGTNGQINVTNLRNTYVQASLLLGSYYNEIRKPQDAIKVLDAGLACQPGNPVLVSEKAASLMVLGRNQEILALTEPLMTSPLTPKLRKARLLRNRGYAYTELKQLDEAEAAYRASLELDPNNGGAKNELSYIAKLRAGAKPTPGAILPADKFKAGDLRPAPQL